MGYVFGPLPSRRLGQSLGVDPLPTTAKICNWNCVYCQLGRTVPLSDLRAEHTPRASILAEVRAALAAHKPGDIDWVTFVGSGETTLHAGLGWLIRQIKELTDIPVAVITNGSLLYLPEVQEDLLAADAVMPSLDAGNARLYRRINRPWAALTFDSLVNGMIEFRRRYRGKLWIEVMLIKGINDGEKELREIAAILARIGPDQVHISLPARPPAEADIELPGEDALARASAILGRHARIVRPAGGAFDLSGYADAADAVLAIISRHPMQEAELRATLERWTPGQVEEALQKLLAGGQAQVVERLGHRFWSAAGWRYPAEK